MHCGCGCGCSPITAGKPTDNTIASLYCFSVLRLRRCLIPGDGKESEPNRQSILEPSGTRHVCARPVRGPVGDEKEEEDTLP
jgi:hypothetical protein